MDWTNTSQVYAGGTGGIDSSSMPWQKGFVPDDGYRFYIHGTEYRIKYYPCGHELKTFFEEDIAGDESIKARYEHAQIGNPCWCGEISKRIEREMNKKISEMPERQYKASKIMGWV